MRGTLDFLADDPMHLFQFGHQIDFVLKAAGRITDQIVNIVGFGISASFN